MSAEAGQRENEEGPSYAERFASRILEVRGRSLLDKVMEAAERNPDALVRLFTSKSTTLIDHMRSGD